MSTPRVHALIPAAGLGERVGGTVPKQYLEVAGKAVLAHAVDALAAHPAMAGVTVVLAAGDRWFRELRFADGMAPECATGGDSRARSVLNGLRQIAERHAPDWVLVHDAARPCLPAACLDRLLQQGLGSPDGAILALPVADTLKRGDDRGRIRATVEREGLWVAQTPQLFPLDRLLPALQRQIEAGEAPTDEAAAMERMGARPLLVMGATANIKITWPGDLGCAAALLAARVVAE